MDAQLVANGHLAPDLLHKEVLSGALLQSKDCLRQGCVPNVPGTHDAHVAHREVVRLWLASHCRLDNNVATFMVAPGLSAVWPN